MKYKFAATGALALAMSTTVLAQSDGAVTADTEGNTASALSPSEQAAKDRLDRITRDRDLLKVQAEIAAQYAGLVPTLTESTMALSGDNAGALEVAFMGTPVIAASATKVAGYLLRARQEGGDKSHVILLSGNEAKPWGDTQVFDNLIDQRTEDLRDKLQKARATDTTSVGTTFGGMNKVLSGFTALSLLSEVTSVVSKAVATETVLSAVPFKAPDGQLMRFLRVMDQSFQRAEPAVTVSADNPLIVKFDALGTLVANATATFSAAKAGATATSPLSPKYIALSESIALANVLIKQLGTPNDSGRMPIIAAARYAELLDGEPLVARIHTDFAGGSVISKKSLATRYLGYDGVRLTAGLVSSYEIEKLDGRSVAVGFVQCRAPYQFVSEAVQKGPGKGTPTLPINAVECAHTAIPTSVTVATD